MKFLKMPGHREARVFIPSLVIAISGIAVDFSLDFPKRPLRLAEQLVERSNRIPHYQTIHAFSPENNDMRTTTRDMRSGRRDVPVKIARGAVNQPDNFGGDGVLRQDRLAVAVHAWPPARTDTTRPKDFAGAEALRYPSTSAGEQI